MAKGTSLKILRHSVLEKEILDPRKPPPSSPGLGRGSRPRLAPRTTCLPPLDRWAEDILTDRATWLPRHVRFSMGSDGTFFPPIEMVIPSSPNWTFAVNER